MVQPFAAADAPDRGLAALLQRRPRRLLLGSFFFALGPLAGLASLVGCAAAAFGIANEQRWGYLLAVAMAVLDVVLIVGGRRRDHGVFRAPC